MPLELYPIQLPQSVEGQKRIPLLLLFDGSGLAYEYNALKPLDRLIYGVSVAVDGGHDHIKASTYLSKEFGTVDAYVDQLVHLLESEVFNENEEDSDSDSDSDSETSEQEVSKSPPALWLGGFSAGGFFAIELARRLLSQPITPTGSSEAVSVSIPGVILLDCFNPSAPEVRVSFQNFVDEGPNLSLPSFDRYPRDSPVIQFIVAHLLHCTKLSITYNLQPFPDEAGRSSPAVHMLRAGFRFSDLVPGPNDHLNYWSTELLPTLDLSTVKTIEGIDHFELWQEGKVNSVSNWLSEVLTS